MNKNSSAKKLNLINEYDHTPLVEWITANRQNILIGFAALIGLLLITYKMLSISINSTETDYLNAETAYQNIQSDQERQENLTQLEGILSRRPDLHAKYDSDVAQLLIIAQDVPQATPFAEGVFKRTVNQGVDFHREYGENTLLIAAGQYESALTRTTALKEKMNQGNQKDFSNTLYGLNLVRIAILQQALNHPKEELQAWEEVQKFAGLQEITALFADGKASLSGYIDGRKAILKKS